jgi:hypothetical protein
MTVANKPGHRGEHDISRKPLRGECRAFSGVTVVTNARVYYHYTRGCGRIGRPAFPAPSDLRGRNISGKPRAPARRDREAAFADDALFENRIRGNSSRTNAPHFRPSSFATGSARRAARVHALKIALIVSLLPSFTLVPLLHSSLQK